MMTGSENKTEAGDKKVQDFNRNSEKIFKIRKAMLSIDERENIFDLTNDVALKYYDEQSFGLGDGEN